MFGWIARRSIERSIERILLSYVVDYHTEAMHRRMQPFSPIEGTLKAAHPTLKARQAYRQSLRDRTGMQPILQPMYKDIPSRMERLRERESARLDRAFGKRPLLYASVVYGYMSVIQPVQMSCHEPYRVRGFAPLRPMEDEIVKAYCTDYRPLREVASELAETYGIRISGDRMRKLARQRLGETLTRRNKEAFRAYERAYKEERS
jgi:hypothetical protein